MKFSIRDLLLVTVIAALAAGWAVDRTRLVNEAARLSQLNPAYRQSGSWTRSIASHKPPAPALSRPKD